MWTPDLADARWVHDVLSRHADALGIEGGVAGVRLVDVRLTHPHRPASPRCHGWATYVVTSPDRPAEQVYLKGFPDRTTAESAWRGDRAARPGGRSHLVDDLVVWRFPDDPLLHALPDLVAAPVATGVVPADAAAVLGGPAGLRVAVVRHQPEASATLRLDGPGGTVFAKHVVSRPVEVLAARHRALWCLTRGDSALRVAEPLALDPVRRVMWTRGVAASGEAASPEGVAGTGALLAALHASGVDLVPEVSVDALVVELGKKAEKLAQAHPPSGPALARLVAAAASRPRGAARDRSVTLHGDFHLDQVIAAAGGPVVVDLDSMRHGPPEVDLAEFLVDLALRQLPEGFAREVAADLLSSYADSGGLRLDEGLLRTCADAEFVNRCYRHLRRHTPGWERDLEAELARHPGVTGLLPS